MLFIERDGLEKYKFLSKGRPNDTWMAPFLCCYINIRRNNAIVSSCLCSNFVIYWNYV